MTADQPEPPGEPDPVPATTCPHCEAPLTADEAVQHVARCPHRPRNPRPR